MTDRKFVDPVNIEPVGVVLAGGSSSRMGLDKRLLRVHGERDMLEQTLLVLGACTSRVVVSCRADAVPDCVQQGRQEFVPDALPEGWLAAPKTTPAHIRARQTIMDSQVPQQVLNQAEGPSRSADNGIGPLAGMYACLKALRAPLLVLSCDLPFMTPKVLQALLSARRAALHAGRNPLLTTFRQVETGFIEALVAIYEAESLPYFEQAIRSGVRKLNMVIPPERREDVLYTQAEALPFFNVNYPADLELARRAWKHTS